jgi:3-oxoacyl-[acyl-carrier protein] reductase
MTETKGQRNTDCRRIAVVTGAARGIGRAIALELARQRHAIVGIDISWTDGSTDASAQSLAAELAALDGLLIPLHGDIGDLKTHEKLLEAILERTGRIDLLVNNAGVAPLQRCDILEMTPESYDRVLGINLRGAVFWTQRVARWLAASRATLPGWQPRIVFITSISAVTSSVNRAEYCISKSGLSMAAALYADRLAALGIPVFEIRPGIILTDMTIPVREKYDHLIGEGLIPQNRWGTAEDVAGVVASIAGGAFDYSTGTVIDVSGGMNIRRL